LNDTDSDNETGEHVEDVNKHNDDLVELFYYSYKDVDDFGEDYVGEENSFACDWFRIFIFAQLK